MRHMTIAIVGAATLSACTPGTVLRQVDAQYRQQVYTLDKEGGGSRLCPVDDHPIDPTPVQDLAPMAVRIGYKSYDNGGRAFCDIDRSYHHYGRLWFDLNELASREGRAMSSIRRITLAADVKWYEDNQCPKEFGAWGMPSALETGASPHPVFSVEYALVRRGEFPDDSFETTVYPVEGEGWNIDNVDYDYRETLLLDRDSGDPAKAGPLLTVPLTDEVTSRIAARPDPGTLEVMQAFTVVPVVNPTLPANATVECFVDLENPRLLILFDDS